MPTCGLHTKSCRLCVVYVRGVYCAVLAIAIGLAGIARAGPVAEANLAANPPMYPTDETACTAEFFLKPVLLNDNHGYVVVTGPDGKKLELRGGPSRFDSSVGLAIPGLISLGSGEQPPGNPFNCTTSHKLGVVVPYVGKHGKLATDSSGNAVYSPDGEITTPSFTSSIGKGAQPNTCAMANCMMTVVKAMGQSCKIYTAGTGVLRNSNTLISLAMSACGLPDPLPKPMSATGWGNPWD
jgi:hypothetical protein